MRGRREPNLVTAHLPGGRISIEYCLNINLLSNNLIISYLA